MMVAPPRRRSGTLSYRLRTETRPCHDAVERRTGWPASIGDIATYRLCLRGLLAIRRPLEATMAGIDWADFAIGHALTRSLTRRRMALDRDLISLGDDPNAVRSVEVVIPAGLPVRVGVLYVLEGSALGGRIIGAELHHRLGGAVAGALSFFTDDTAGLCPSWRDTVLAIDAFGLSRPREDADAAIKGAEAAFAAFLQAFPAAPNR